MSSSTRWVIAALSVLVIANLASGVVRKAGAEKARADWSTYRSGGQGTLALYRTLGRLGYDVRRLEAPLTQIPDDCALLWLLYPTDGLAYDELVALRDWVAGGGRLVCSWDAIVHIGLFQRWMIPGQEEQSPFPELMKLQPELSLSAGLPTVPALAADGVGRAVVPTNREGIFEGVSILWSPTGRGLASSEGWTALARVNGSPLVAARRVGSGVVVFLGDPEMLGNAAIGRVDNAVLASNMAWLAGGPSYFAEYQHGFTDRPLSVVGLIRSSPLAVAAYSIVAGLALGLLAVGIRLGRPLPPYDPPRRSSLEFVGALAMIYRRAQARDVALSALYAAAIRRLAGQARTRETADHSQLARFSAHRVGMDAESVRSVLDSAATILKRGCENDTELATLARGLASITRPRADWRSVREKRPGQARRETRNR